MPATTPNGLPYPLGTDRVMDGDDSIKSLAEGVRITHGVFNVSLPTVSSYVGTAITFPAGLFASKPVITASYGAQATLANLGALGVASITTTGAVINAYRSGGGSAFAVDVHWQAMRVGTGPGPA